MLAFLVLSALSQKFYDFSTTSTLSHISAYFLACEQTLSAFSNIQWNLEYSEYSVTTNRILFKLVILVHKLTRL